MKQHRTHAYSDYVLPLLRKYIESLDVEWSATGVRLNTIRVDLAMLVRADWRRGKLTDSDVAHLLDLILDQ